MQRRVTIRILKWLGCAAVTVLLVLYCVSFKWAVGVPRQGTAFCFDCGELKVFRDAFWETPDPLAMSLMMFRDEGGYYSSHYWWPASGESPSLLLRVHGPLVPQAGRRMPFAPELRSHGGAVTIPMYLFVLLVGVPTGVLIWKDRKRERDRVERS